MENIIVQGVVGLVTALVKIASDKGETVDLSKVMATAAARAGASMSEYNAQLEEQRRLFPGG